MFFIYFQVWTAIIPPDYARDIILELSCDQDVKDVNYKQMQNILTMKEVSIHI